MKLIFNERKKLCGIENKYLEELVRIFKSKHNHSFKRLVLFSAALLLLTRRFYIGKHYSHSFESVPGVSAFT